MRISDWSSDVCSSDLWSRHIPCKWAKPVRRLPARWLLLRSADRLLQHHGGIRHLQGEEHAIQPGIPPAILVRWPDQFQRGRQLHKVQDGERLRSEERGVGKECVSTCKSRLSPLHKKKQKKQHRISRDKQRT